MIFSSADNSVRMWDRRNLGPGGAAGSPIHKFEGHKAAVLCVQACTKNFLITYMFFSPECGHLVAVHDSALAFVDNSNLVLFSGLLTKHLFLEALQKMVS